MSTSAARSERAEESGNRLDEEHQKVATLRPCSLESCGLNVLCDSSVQ